MRKLIVLLLLLCSCRPEATNAPKAEAVPTVAPASPTPAPVEAPAPQVAPTEAAAPAAPAQPDPRLDKLLAKVLERQTCNRVTGCPASLVLCKTGQQALPTLDQALSGGQAHGWQRCRLYWTMGCIGGEGARGRLLEARAKEATECRLEALLALARMGDKRDLPLFQETLKAAAQDDLTRGAAAWGLGRLGDPEGPKVLLAMLADPGAVNPGATTVALEAVTALRLEDACALMPKALAPREVFSLRAALAAVETLGCPGLEAELQALTTAPWPSVATQAKKLLGKTRP